MTTAPAPQSPPAPRPPSATHAPRLSRRSGDGRPSAPVRIVHLGLGNFFRAHQAWYTEHAKDASRWGIAAFTGRSRRTADLMVEQDGLYTLLTRGADGDRTEVISSITAVHGADEHGAWLDYWSDPHLAIVTLTVTEAAYLRGPDGGLESARPDVTADVTALRADQRAPVRTVPGRLVAGLLARRAAEAGAVTLLPCDNLSENGPALELVVADLARAVDPSLLDWMAENVVVGTTMVDRITPATTEADTAEVLARTGRVDLAPVPTEPFSEWVIQAEFPKGRPHWETAGAKVVKDVVPFEQRKLWLLNGSHSLLAYAGSARGHETVADAIADPVLRGWVEEWWDEAQAHLPLDLAEVTAYRAALVERFENPAIRHALAQIAADGSQKLRVRAVPVLRAELAAGRVPRGAARLVAAWVAHLHGVGAPVVDARSAEVGALVGADVSSTAAAVLGYLDPDLRRPDLVAVVALLAEEIVEQVPAGR